MRRILVFLLSALAVFCSCQKEEPSISVDGNTDYRLDPSQVRLQIKVSCTSEDWNWDLGGASWLTSPTREDNKLMVTVAANESEEPRSAVITLFINSKDSGPSATVSVTQQGRIAEPEITVQDSSDLPGEGGTITIPVSTNQSGWEFELTEGGDGWLSLFRSSDGLVADAQPNPAELDRSARVRLYAPDKASARVYKDIVLVQRGIVIEYDPVDLSEHGTSNCYIITHRGVHSFNATVCGNGQAVEGLAAPSSLAPAGAKLVWQTVRDMITNLSYKDGIISFEASRAPGSAVIAATDAAGTIIWSWHIWHPEIEVEALPNSTGSLMMNMNLGALNTVEDNISSHGMLYQWGRKDPFPYSPVAHNGTVYIKNIDVYNASGAKVEIRATDRYSTKNNTLAYSIQNPDACISNNNQYSKTRDWLLPAESNLALWGNPSGADHSGGKYANKGQKSYFDPCPPGWRVPPVQEFAGFTESGGYTWAVGDTEAGLYFQDLGGDAVVAVVDYDGDGKYTLGDYLSGWWMWLDRKQESKSYFPAATRYDGQYAMLMGSMVGLWGNYWTNSASDDTSAGLAIALSFSLKDYSGNYQITVSPVANGSRADAYSIRCIKE